MSAIECGTIKRMKGFILQSYSVAVELDIWTRILFRSASVDELAFSDLWSLAESWWWWQLGRTIQSTAQLERKKDEYLKTGEKLLRSRLIPHWPVQFKDYLSRVHEELISLLPYCTVQWKSEWSYLTGVGSLWVCLGKSLHDTHLLSQGWWGAVMFSPDPIKTMWL